MLGNPGSNPLELFWDAVDALDQKLDAKINVVEAVVKRWSPSGIEAHKQKPDGDGDVKMGETDKGFVDVDTTEEQFMNAIKDDATDAVKQLSAEDLREVFTAVRILNIFFRFLGF
jgi:pre-mRNA-processing factor 40